MDIMSNTPLDARTRAFDADFWPQLQKAYSKLRGYQYGRELRIERGGMIMDSAEENERSERIG
jgi:hypothetical protein